ncbi:MAG TPA: potassium channel family protein [Pyrinomonadaceae bacterium]|nr:potassium channel family protein [Pyrinomonadaceae bacterium]
MRIIGLLFGVALIATILWDTFETIILPRRVTRRIRLTSLFYRSAWKPSFAIARGIKNDRQREKVLSLFGPMSLFFLLGIWTSVLIVGYALVFWGTHQPLNVVGERVGFSTHLYLSGVTFFTLGYGDVSPIQPFGRFLSVVETANGLGLFAVVISYLPVLYQSFSRRETSISLLDARAGSPSSAVELLRRHCANGNYEELTRLLSEWERWSAELLESHLSYPVLCYFRSQHDNQSWLRALTTVLDTCALVMVGLDGPAWQARMTFAMTRHAVVDIAQVLKTKPRKKALCANRLTATDFQRLRSILVQAGVELPSGDIEQRISELREMYEPYVFGLADQLLMPLPPWILPPNAVDNWKTSAWGRIQ